MTLGDRPPTQRVALERAATVAAEWHPAMASRFDATLARLTRPILAQPDQHAAWSRSRLNGNGSPVEFTFSTLDDAVRYTVEIGGAEVAPADRLAHLGALLADLGAPPANPALVEAFAAMQADATLRWGAWLGVRHHLGGDVFKLYVEVPPDAPERATALLPDGLDPCLPLAPSRSARMAAIGHTLGTDRREVYFALSPGALSREELAGLLVPVGLASRAGDMLDLIGSFMVGGSRRSLPDIEYGLSYAARGSGAEPAASVFVFASDLIGGDGAVRMQTLATTARRGWSLGAYAAMTAPLAHCFNRCDHHNVLAVVAGAAPTIGVHVSLSPPDPSLARAP